MDSNHTSVSLQSSSGGDDGEYDSRAATFINHHHFSRQPPPTPPSSIFDPPSSSSGYNFVNQNPLLNLDMLTWSKSFRSDDPPPPPQPPPPQTIQAPVPAVRPSPSQGARGVGPVRNSNAKKRSRASRRAPTTVLTTDTSNFRAMVQEFTGIPAPPFSTHTSLFPRTNATNQQRLDFFSNTPPNYRLLSRQQQPTPIVPIANHINSNDFQLPSPVVNSDHPPQVTANNPIPSFQSLLQTSPSNTYSLPQFRNALSGMESAGTSSSPSMLMMMRRRSNIISHGDPRQQQQDLGAATSSSNIDQDENVASRSEGMVESWISSSD